MVFNISRNGGDNMIGLNRRRTMGNALPYDAEIEYLESDGYCVVSTNTVLTGYDNTIYAKFLIRGYTSEAKYYGNVWGCYGGEVYNTYRVIRGGGNDKSILIYNGRRASDGYTRNSYALNTVCNLTLNPNNYIINGTTKNYTNNNNRGTENTVVFKPFFNWSKLLVYYFKVLKGDSVILDLIPVRVGQVGYMYDKVSGQLFGNSGTGNFILGNDVN